MPELALDALVGAGLVWLAWSLLRDPDLVRAAMSFIVFGLLLSLAWVRLDAPDIALAEAAIGAGITGVLVLDAARNLPAPSSTSAPWPVGVAGVACGLAVAAGLGAAVVALPDGSPGLAPLVEAGMTDVGVDHGVTAVLLGFRALDTWLEVAVLLFALIGGVTLARSWDVARGAPRAPVEPLLAWFGRILAPLILLSAGFLLWLGTTEPGGAFQAGAILGALGVIGVLAGLLSPRALHPGGIRAIASSGAVAFLALAVAGALVEGSFLRAPAAVATEAIITVEAAITVTIGVTLAALVLGARPGEDGGEGEG